MHAVSGRPGAVSSAVLFSIFAISDPLISETEMSTADMCEYCLVSISYHFRGGSLRLTKICSPAIRDAALASSKSVESAN